MGHYISFGKVPKNTVAAPQENYSGEVLLLDYEDLEERDIPVRSRIRSWKNQHGLLDALVKSGYHDPDTEVGPWVIRKEDIDRIVEQCRECRAQAEPDDPWTQYIEFEEFLLEKKSSFDFDKYWFYYTAS